MSSRLELFKETVEGREMARAGEHVSWATRMFPATQDFMYLEEGRKTGQINVIKQLLPESMIPMK